MNDLVSFSVFAGEASDNPNVAAYAYQLGVMDGQLYQALMTTFDAHRDDLCEALTAVAEERHRLVMLGYLDLLGGIR